MAGLYDLLQNPRRLRQFAQTPGNFPAALSFASQGSMAARPATRARQSTAKEDEEGVLKTGEVIDKVRLPDGTYVRPATESGQLVKAPGKSNLYLDPATGEPYQADPAQPGGIRSAWSSAKRTTREGKEFAVIPGVGERELGPDPKAAEEAAKREAENRRLAFAREKRPYNIDRITGEPVPLQSDEEWQKQKAAKQAALDQAARVKRLKTEADLLKLDARQIELETPKPAKEDEDAFTAARDALAMIAPGEDADAAAERLANAPDTGDEAALVAKQSAQAYLASREKVRPAQEAAAKVREMSIRALDLEKQALNPDAWKAEKQASLKDMTDDDLMKEATAQAEIITKQESEASDKLNKITTERNALVEELNAFTARRQQAEAEGLSLNERAALDQQQADMEAAIADYDDWNSEAEAEAQAALKAAADRREVLQTAGSEIENRNAVRAQTAEQAQARAAMLEKGRSLYETWGKGLYMDDWRDQPDDDARFQQEAKKAGLSLPEAKEALQTFRQLDWSNIKRDPKTAEPIEEQARLLPDGNVTVNPANLLDPEAYNAAVDAVDTTPEAKERAKAMRAELAAPVAEEAYNNLRKNADFAAWLDENTSGTPLERMEKFNAEMKAGGALNAALMQFLGSTAGLPSGWLGAIAGLTGSDKAMEYANWWKDRAQAYGTAAGEAGKGTNMAGRFMASVAGGLPSVMESLAVGGVAGRVLGSGAAALGAAAVDAAAQSGGNTFLDATEAYIQQGLTPEEAKAKAATPAIASGLVTAVLTAIGGGGVESLLRTEGQALAKAAIKRGIAAQVGEGVADEAVEEWADQMLQGVVAQLSYDPNKPLEQVFAEATEAGLVGGVLGGGASGLRAFMDRNTPTEGGQPYTPNAPAPDGGPAPTMPTQPRPAGQENVSKIIAAFQPTGTPMPQAVNDTIKRTGRAPDQVAQAAASGLVKVAQGASLESLDAREREALGFINKDGKIVPAPKTTPLVEIYKDKLVIRNEAAEWLDDEGQPVLARQIKLDEAERKAQIDEAVAKSAKKKAGQATPKAAESAPQDSEAVITGGSFPPIIGSNPILASTTDYANQGQSQASGIPTEVLRQEQEKGGSVSSEMPGILAGGNNDLQVEQGVRDLWGESSSVPRLSSQGEQQGGEYSLSSGIRPEEPGIRGNEEMRSGVQQLPQETALGGERSTSGKTQGSTPVVSELVTPALTPAQAAKATPEQKARVAKKGRAKATVPAAEVQPPAKPAAVDEAAQEAATSPAAEAQAGPAMEMANSPASKNLLKPYANIAIPDLEKLSAQDWNKRRSYLEGKIQNNKLEKENLSKTPKNQWESREYNENARINDVAASLRAAIQDMQTARPDLETEFKAKRAKVTGEISQAQGQMGTYPIEPGRTDSEFQRESASLQRISDKPKTPADRTQANKDQPVSLRDVASMMTDEGEAAIADLFQAGQSGLSDAINRFRGESSAKGSTLEDITFALDRVLEEWGADTKYRDSARKKMVALENRFYSFEPSEPAPASQEQASPPPASQETASQPEAQPATPLARAQAAIAAYQAKAVEAKKAATSQKDKNTANRQIVGAKHLAEQLAKLEGAVEYEIATAFKGAPIPSMMVIPAGKGGLLAINPAGLLDSITNNNLDAKAITKAIDKFIVHELIHKAALGRLSDSRILDLYNALTPAAKEASRKLYLAQAGENPPPLDEFQAAHEWFAQLVEARMTGEISNQALIEASDDATFRDKLIALLRDFVAQLRDIAGLVKDKAMAEQIRAEADAVQAAAEAMAAKAGLEIQPKTETPPTVSEQFKAVEPMATAMMEQSKGANADATKQSFEEWASEFGVTDLAENPTLTEKLRATYNQKRAKAGLQVKADEAEQAEASQPAAQAQPEPSPAQAVPTAGEAEAPALPPTQSAAVAKEEAMPEPAKQAAPFDAAAAKGQKKFLLAEVANAVKAAPRRADLSQEARDGLNAMDDDLKRWSEIEKILKDRPSAELSIELSGIQKRIPELTKRLKTLVGVVTIEVPGDGTFTILNEKGALAQFQKRADKFPVSAIRDDMPAKPTAQAPTAVPALKKPKTTADVVAAIYPMVADNDTRGMVLNYVSGDGTHLFATDGSVLVRVEHENGGGKGKEKVLYDEKGVAKPLPDDERPYDGNQVIPDDKDFTLYTLDTGRWFSLMSQARAVLKDLPGEGDSGSKSASLYRNQDGSLGVFANDVNRGDYAHNIQPEAKFLASYNAEYMQTIMRVARNLGQEQIEMRIQDDITPATFRAGPALFVLMPMRVNGAPAYSPQAQAARPAPPVTAQAKPSMAEQVQQAAGAGFTETSLPKAKPAFRVRTLKGGERVIEKFEGKDKGWKRQIALRGEEMDDPWIQKWVESRNGFLMPTDEPAQAAKPSPEAQAPAEAPASQEPAQAAGPASIGQENMNAKHSREWAEVSTEPTMSNPKGSLKTDAIRSKTPSAPWYYQGDIRQLAFNQKVIEGGKSAATPEGAQTLKEYSAAVKDGWSYTSVRAGSYGTVYVFRKGKQVLTNAGAAALTSEAMARPESVPESRGGNETNTVSRLAQYSAKLMEWLQTLPESTLNSPVALSTKMRNDVLAKWVRLREPDYKPYEWQLQYLKPDGKPDVQFFAPSLEGLIKKAINYAVIYRDMPAADRDRGYGYPEFKDAPTVAETLAANGFAQPAEPSAQETAPSEAVQPITGFESARSFIGKLREGQVTAEQVRTAWAQLKAARPAILADLNKMKVDDLLPMAGISARKSDGKAAIAKNVLNTLDMYFNPDGTISYSFGRDMQANKDAAMDEKVAKWTDEMIVEQARARREDAEARKAAREKAMTNPETKDEWDRFVFAKGRQALTPEEIQAIKKLKSGRNEAVIRKGESLLTPEQLAAYDAVRGIDRKAAEQARTEAQARVYGVTTGVEADIVETKHTQKGHDLFVVKLSERVERPVYDRLNSAAKKLGGYYSSYSKGGAVPGFQFTSRAAAENFIAVSKGETVDQKQQIQERQEAKKSATASRLNALADGLDAKADGILSADRKTNTAKRAREAAGQEANARKMQAMAQTMRNLAAAMESGEATHLDGVTAGTHVDTLDGMARSAMQSWANSKNLTYSERQKAEEEGPTAEMMDAARIPYPYLDKSTILNMVEAGRKTPGAKLLAERVAKIQMNEDDGRAVTLRRDDDLENVKELAQKVYYAGGIYWNSIKWKYETYDRLKAMGLTNLPSLRAALREYLQYRGKAAKADPVKAMERELIGMKLPGFFPTPRPIIDEMIGLAGIRPGMKVLEPSAGKGDIAQAAQEAGAEVDAIELSSRLRDILQAKGINVVDNDFTTREPSAEYDAVVMNPPFENGQDIEHVQHAYKFLKEGGTLVAVMSAGPFYRQDKQATAFREWLDEQNSTYEAMPEGSFAGADAFRQTGVRTYLVTIRKPYSSMPKMADEGQAGPGLAMPPAGQAVTPGQDGDDGLEAAARAAMGEAEEGQPATEAEDLAETERLMEEQQRLAEAEEKAREELRNDPANIAAVQASGAMSGRNLSKQFTDPAARSFYQALTAARDMLGGPETVVFDELRKWAARRLETDPAGAIAYATELADNKTIPGVEGQAVLAAVVEALNREVALTGDKNQRLLLTRLGNYYLDLGTIAAQSLGFRRDIVESPQDRWNKALRVVFGPAEKVRRRLRLAPTEAAKARRIAELEAQLASYQGSRRADIEAALADAKRQETQESIIAKEDAKNEKLKSQILGRMGLTERDLTLSPTDRYALQTAILDLPQVREALSNYIDGRDIIRLALRGFSDEHIANSLGLSQDDVAKFIKYATNAIIRPAVKAEVKANRGFGDMVKSGLQSLARKVGLRMAAVSGPLGTMSPPLTAAELAKVEQEVNDILNFALQPAARRNKAGNLISKVIDTPGGKKVRVFVPFDPDDAASFYAFAREFSTAKSNVFDKLYEYWINWPLLGGPQTQVANITGNAAQLAWHYTGQRLAEAALNVAYRDPNSAQLSEFKHIATAFFRSMGPALDMARQSFLTEGDTVRHKYLNEPMEIEFKDGSLDKLGTYRPAIGGKAGRIARLPGRLLRFADAFFKTAILHTEAAALAYRKAHAAAKAQRLTGANRAAFIDAEMANDMNNPGSDVWVKAADTAEELLFQDDSAAAIWTQALLGGNIGIKGIEKLQTEAEMRGDAAKAAKLASAVGLLKLWGKLMRWIFPFQRTPTNIIKTGLRKAGGAAIVAAWHATRAGMISYQDGKPFIESYTKAMQIKDLSESLLAGLGWLMLSSTFEGDDDDEKKPILIVGNRPYSPGKTGEREAFLRQTGGANAILFRDKDGKTIGTFNFSRYEPVATLLSAWVDGYRNFREVNRRRSQGEPDASYLTYIGSSLLSSVEGKSFLQGFSGLMETIRDFEERREPSTTNWAAKKLINAAIPNIIKQPLRNWDELVRDTKNAGIGYTALPNPEVAPKLPAFQAEPKITTTGERIQKGYTAPARLLFQANTVVTPQPDSLLFRLNRLRPTTQWNPQPLQKDDFYVRAPGAKEGTPGYKTPITDPAKRTQFAVLVGRKYAEKARRISATISPDVKANPPSGLQELYKKAMTEARAEARAVGGIMGLHK